MKNTFIEELRKYERKALEPWVAKNCAGKMAASTNLRMLVVQVTELKNRMAGYRPLLSDDIVVAFESLLWKPILMLLIVSCIHSKFKELLYISF